MRKTRALTLIEVVASLVLLATTATALLLAQGRSLQQLQTIRAQETAAILGHELITNWKLQEPKETIPLSGVFGGYPKWRWERSARESDLAGSQNLQEISLRLYRRDHQGVERLRATYTWLEPIDEGV